MIDVLRDLIDEQWIMNFEEFEEALDFSNIPFELIHESRHHGLNDYVIKIEESYFIAFEYTSYDRRIEIKKVKPQVVTRTEYIEVD